MSQNLKLLFYGGAGTVTGSKAVIEYNGARVLFDCGLFQGPRELRLRNRDKTDDLCSVQAVVLSHAHIDHSGYLPKLVRDGFRGPVYCTPATAELARLLLLDAAYLQEEDARYANETGHSKHAPAVPLFTTQDAERAIKLLKPIDFHHWQELVAGLQFQFYRAGHILGSAVTQFSFASDQGIKILTMSGDLGNGRSEVLEDPEKILETDYLVLESTYGDRQQPRVSPLDAIENVIRTVVGRGGTLVIPAFSVGRTQELLFLIHELEKQGRITPYPVYLDSPMAKSATEVYLRFPNELKKVLHGDELRSRLSCSRFLTVDSTDESMLLCMSTEPKIVISAAGMLSGGRVLHHLKAKLPDEKSGVLFVGYQATGTKGLLLKNGLRKIRIHHQEVAVEAEVFSIDSLSAHADCEDLSRFVKDFRRKPQKIYLNHGELNALESLRYLLTTDHGVSVEIAQEQKQYVLA